MAQPMTEGGAPRLTLPLKYRLFPLRLYKYVRYAARYRKSVHRGEPELRLLRFLARRDRISVDVGANRGTFTLPLSWHSRGVVAFEPPPYMHFLLEQSRISRTTIHPCALGDRDDQVDLFVPVDEHEERPNLSTTLVAAPGPRAKIYRVSMRTLDSFALEDVGFIKIDVEGSELAVLRGAADTIRRSLPVIQCEILDFRLGQPEPGRQKIGFLTERGYVAVCILDNTLRTFASVQPCELSRCRNLLFFPGAAA